MSLYLKLFTEASENTHLYSADYTRPLKILVDRNGTIIINTFNHHLSTKLILLLIIVSADEDSLSSGYGGLVFLLCSELDYTLYEMSDFSYLQAPHCFT